MSSFLKAYNALLQRKPTATQCITGAVLFGAGDILAQQAVEKQGRNHDFVRTARMTFFGGALFAPVVTKWYKLLNRLQFASPTKAVVYRVWLDQAVFSPAAVVFFFSSMSFLEGNDISEAKRRLEEAYVPTLVRNWSVFLPTQIINFAFVPHHLRFVFMGVVSLFWNTYLSYANAQTQRSPLSDSLPPFDKKIGDSEKSESVKNSSRT